MKKYFVLVLLIFNFLNATQNKSCSIDKSVIYSVLMNEGLKKRMIDASTLASITKKSEVVENNSTNNGNVEQSSDDIVIVRKKAKKITKAISISLPLDSYNEYIKYLNDNDIDSGSELIRKLLKEANIIS